MKSSKQTERKPEEVEDKSMQYARITDKFFSR